MNLPSPQGRPLPEWAAADTGIANGSTPPTKRSPEAIIAWDGNRSVTVAQFFGALSGVAAVLPDRKYVFNLCGNPRHYLYGFYAAMLRGQCTLMPPNRLQTTLEEIRADYAEAYVLDDRGQGDFDLAAALHGLEGKVPDATDCPLIPDTRLCAIAFTSGSTGRPQPNRKNWRTLRVGSRSNAQMLLGGLPGPASLVATVPPQHMWGLETTILLPLFGEAAVSGRSPFYPQEIKEALEELREPRVLVSTPVHLRALLDSGLDLPPMARILSATAPLTTDLAAGLERRHSTDVLEVFGCSESGILASRPVAREQLWTLADIFHLDVMDGQARIQARHLPEQVVLQDVVEPLPGKRFRWLGRHADQVKIAGKRASLADINRRLLEIPGVSDGVVFFPAESEERLAALVVASGLTHREILDALRPQLDPVFLPRPMLMVERLPRSETGKLPRSAVLELFAQLRS